MNTEKLIKEAIYTSDAENWKQYEESTIKLIKKLRPEVTRELFKDGPENHQEKLMQGSRFDDDKDVWHALIMNIKHPFEPNSKNPSIFDDPKKLEKSVKDALKDAASADYYYRYDKDYGMFDD